MPPLKGWSLSHYTSASYTCLTIPNWQDIPGRDVCKIRCDNILLATPGDWCVQTYTRILHNGPEGISSDTQAEAPALLSGRISGVAGHWYSRSTTRDSNCRSECHNYNKQVPEIHTTNPYKQNRFEANCANVLGQLSHALWDTSISIDQH